MSLRLIAILLPALFSSFEASHAQQVNPPAPATQPRPDLIRLIAFDRFAAENQRLMAAPAAQPRIILMGDSITEGWKKADPGLFDDRTIDRGISGQTTPQMLLRFRPDVIDLHPAVVVILAGINDLAGNTGPESVPMIEGNIASMAELAQVNHSAVVLSSITPADHFSWRPGINPAADIHTINEWMRTWAAAHHCVYLDYFSALAGPEGTMSKERSLDGVHPTAAGYAIMRPLMERSVAQALAQRPH